MTHVLVLQWDVDDAGDTDDLDALVAMEDALEASLPAACGSVDGHDLGSGEMNLFVLTDEPVAAFRACAAVLGAEPRWAGVRAAYRAVDGEEYVVVWPPGLDVFAVV